MASKDNVKKDNIAENYYCTECQIPCPDREIHIREKHASNLPFIKCPFCPYRSSAQKSVSHHISANHRSIIFFGPTDQTDQYLKQFNEIQENIFEWPVRENQLINCSAENSNSAIIQANDAQKNGIFPQKRGKQPNRIGCKLCGQTVSNEASAFRSHAWRHVSEKRYSCSKCQNEQMDIFGIKRHLFKCSLVYKSKNSRETTFEEVTLIDRYEQLKTELYEKMFSCFEFTPKYRRPNRESGTRITCEMCKVSLFRKKIKSHVIVHHLKSSFKQFSCSECPYESSRNCVMQTHIRVHNRVHEMSGLPARIIESEMTDQVKQLMIEIRKECFPSCY